MDSPTSSTSETGSADSIDLTAALRAEGAALLAAGRRAGIDAAVSSCGTWSVGDLVWHLTEVYSLFGQVVSGRLVSVDDVVRGERPADADLFDGCAAALAALAAALDGADDSTPAWTFTADRTVGFIRRRMAVETAVHCWDAQRAAGLD
ncbi:MAG: maleylpyruvate isomerase N-terminal domain-containing protein, partial [Ilumatobacteraceae bacterium]